MQKLCNQPADCEKEMEESRLRHLFSTIDRLQAKFSLAGISVKAITFKFSVFSVCSVVIKPYRTHDMLLENSGVVNLNKFPEGLF